MKSFHTRITGSKKMNTTRPVSTWNRPFTRTKLMRRMILSAVLLFTVILAVSCSPTGSDSAAQMEEMSTRLGILEDTQAIRNLHHSYGYYIDKCLYEDVVDLFADDGEVHFVGGIYKGREEGVRRLYVGGFLQGFTGGIPGPVYGFLLDHLQMQDVIHVAPDRQTAKARFRAFMQAGSHETRASLPPGQLPVMWWEGGIYENSYVKEDGIWKIQVLNYRPLWHAEYDKGWAYTEPDYVAPPEEIYPENPTGPDELMDPQPVIWPDTAIVPFHYTNPVTGKPLTMESDWNSETNN